MEVVAYVSVVERLLGLSRDREPTGVLFMRGLALLTAMQKKAGKLAEAYKAPGS